MEETRAELSGARWRKSSHSNANGCVEVALLDGYVAVRSSRDRHNHHLLFTHREWQAFLDGVRGNEFDILE